MPATIIDSHAHLGWDSFAGDRDEVIERAFASGVTQIVQAGVHLDTVDEMIAIAERYERIYFGVGLHPHEAKDWNDKSEGIIDRTLTHPKLVAIGECGLDYHYNYSQPAVQRDVFARQVLLAARAGLPLIIHTREAWADTLAMLNGAGPRGGVFHCFTGGPDVIPAILDLGFYVSFSGIVTFPKATDIQEAARLVPEDRLMVETDCPYLAPEGLRGKRNEPANVWKVAEKLAELRQTSVEQIAQVTSRNARTLFDLPVC